MHGELNIEEIDLKEHPEVLAEFQTTEWALSDNQHFGEVSRDYSRKKFLYLARQDNQITGYIVMETNMGVATIEVVIVKMSDRGHGIGKILIRHVIDEAQKKGCHVIKLETGVSWQARLVYEKIGFNIRAVLPNYYGNQEYVLMDMKLTANDF